MPEYNVELGPKAVEAFASLSRGDQRLVVRQLEKLKRAPELGAPLGNKMGYDLVGCRKLYAADKRLRVIYEIDQGNTITVLAVGPRDKARVYAVAEAELSQRRLRRIS
jgi:mRNA-degrading endonuclease RelE of RelBE toxin-antitoxin system